MDDASRNRSEPADGQGDSVRLDGNAAAGILSEIFVSDLTMARATCAGCGAIRPLGALMVYAHSMGTIMRCPTCDAPVLRVARTRAHLQLDLTGASLVVMPNAPAPFAT
jgi:Family of unknown function (DUF6510)